MRRMILTSLVLLPVMAHAQAATSTEPQPSTSSASLHAELTGHTVEHREVLAGGEVIVRRSAGA